jgi:hypothetical protein
MEIAASSSNRDLLCDSSSSQKITDFHQQLEDLRNLHVPKISSDQNLSHGLNSSFQEMVDFYQMFEGPGDFHFLGPFMQISTDEPVSTVVLPGNQLFGDVTFLGQFHPSPQMKDSDYRNIYIGIAQARLFMELEEGKFRFVFCEGKCSKSRFEPETFLIVREEFARLFSAGFIPSWLNKEQVVFFYNNPASIVYAACHPDVQLLGVESILLNELALFAISIEDIPLKMRDFFVHDMRDAYIVGTLSRFFSDSKFRGEHVALILGNAHSMGMTEQLLELIELHSITDLPLIVKKSFSLDVKRCSYLSAEVWSSDLYDFEGKAQEQYEQVCRLPMLTWRAFKSLDTTEAQLAALSRLEVTKAEFPTAESLREWLIENRLTPAVINGELSHINVVDVPKLFVKQERFGSGEEAECVLFPKDKGDLNTGNSQERQSSSSPHDFRSEDSTKFERGGIPLGDPMLHLIEYLYEKKEGPFSLYL